jgi:hypothetical protein
MDKCGDFKIKEQCEEKERNGANEGNSYYYIFFCYFICSYIQIFTYLFLIKSVLGVVVLVGALYLELIAKVLM